ncbi:MAG: hypothetical protein R3C05_18645 [Pirellulaceae bacterium]
MSEPSLGNPNSADDGGVVELNPTERPGGLTGAPLSGGNLYAGTYGGEYGMGAFKEHLGSQALTDGRPVRPY